MGPRDRGRARRRMNLCTKCTNVSFASPELTSAPLKLTFISPDLRFMFFPVQPLFLQTIFLFILFEEKTILFHLFR